MKKAIKARNEKAALQLLLRGGVDKGRCSGLDYFQGPAVTITKGTEKMIYLGIDSPLFGVEEGIGRYIQCPYLLHNIITKNCRAKWRILHLQNGENCRGYSDHQAMKNPLQT